MDQFAQRPRSERTEVIEETSVCRGISRPAIIEKDFWVCWALHQLRSFFGEAALSPGTNQATRGLLFKGGTSLSKVYNVIDRFSEDIDLTIDQDTLGFTGDSELSTRDISNRHRERLLDELSNAAADFVAQRIRAVLVSALATTTRDGEPATVGVRIDAKDAQQFTSLTLVPFET